MKLVFILIMICMPVGAFAAAPSTSCPTGFIAKYNYSLTIFDGSCPTGYVSLGTATSCLVSAPSGVCIMYAPANTPYTDNAGTYEFTNACAMQ